MNTITISEQDFFQLKAAIAELQAKVQALEAAIRAPKVKKAAASKKTEAKVAFIPMEKGFLVQNPNLTWEFGAGKHLIRYMADDFTAPLEDMKEYM